MKGFWSKALIFVVAGLWASLVIAAQPPAATTTPSVPPKASEVQPLLHWYGPPLLPAPMSLKEALQKALTHPHLRPDARFVSALGIIERFPDSPGDAAPTAEFARGKWSVSYEGHQMGTLPEYPDFSDAMTLLRQVARQRSGDLHLAGNPVTKDETASGARVLDEHSLIEALRSANSRYAQGGLSGADLTMAAEAVSRLAFLEHDFMGTADGLYAKAMALLALAETATGQPMPKEEAMLASGMGYEGAAWAQTKMLTHDDTWRSYLESDDDALEHAARLHPDDPDSNYLWLRRLAESNRGQEWASLMQRRYGSGAPPVSVFDTEVRMLDLEPLEGGSTTLPLLVLSSLPGAERLGTNPPDTARQPAEVLVDFDQGASRLQEAIKGPYLTADDAVAYYRGFLDTGLAMLGVYYLDRLDDQGQAKAYLDELGKAHDANGLELHAWYDAKWHGDQGDLSMEDLMASMAAAKTINPGTYHGAWSRVTGNSAGDDPKMRAAAWQLASLYDSRTEMRRHFADTLHWINDIPDFERTYLSLADQESERYPFIKLRLAGYDDDLEALFRAAEDKRLDKYTRVLALVDVRDVRDAPKQVSEAYKAILSDYPDYSFAYVNYARFLDNVQDYAEIERIAPAWLSADEKGATGFDYPDACVAIAGAELHLRHADKAWQTISKVLFEKAEDPASQPVIANYYGPVLSEGVYAALGQGDFTEAEMLAHTAAERYPDCFECQEPLLNVYWKEKRYDDAAQYLASWPYRIPPWQWAHNFAYMFAQAFKSDTNAGVEAYKAMKSAKIPGGVTVLGYLATGIEYTNPDLAYAIRHARKVLPFDVEGLDDILADYNYFKRTKGAEYARAYALPKLKANQALLKDPGEWSARALITYQSGVYDLVWDVTPDPEVSADPAMIWLFRASAYVQDPVETPQQLAALKRHFAKAGDGWPDLLGKYLLGYADAAAILDRPLDVRSLSEASYYFALRALAEHRYTDAENWLEVDFEAQRTETSAYWWGENLRAHWNLAYQVLPVLDKKGTLYQDKH